MKTIVLEKNTDGKVVLTVDEIKKMLDDAYYEGFQDCEKSDHVSITYPSIYPSPYWSTVVTCGNDSNSCQVSTQS